VAGAVELQIVPPVELPEYLNSAQLYGFYDIGAVWGSGFTRQSLASTGAGLRVGLASKFRLQFEAALPLTRPRTPGETGNGDARFFVSLSGQF
jgi:hemolysin activation/secretion protein